MGFLNILRDTTNILVNSVFSLVSGTSSSSEKRSASNNRKRQRAGSSEYISDQSSSPYLDDVDTKRIRVDIVHHDQRNTSGLSAGLSFQSLRSAALGIQPNLALGNKGRLSSSSMSSNQLNRKKLISSSDGSVDSSTKARSKDDIAEKSFLQQLGNTSSSISFLSNGTNDQAAAVSGLSDHAKASELSLSRLRTSSVRSATTPFLTPQKPELPLTTDDLFSPFLSTSRLETASSGISSQYRETVRDISKDSLLFTRSVLPNSTFSSTESALQEITPNFVSSGGLSQVKSLLGIKYNMSASTNSGLANVGEGAHPHFNQTSAQREDYARLIAALNSFDPSSLRKTQRPRSPRSTLAPNVSQQAVTDGLEGLRGALQRSLEPIPTPPAAPEKEGEEEEEEDVIDLLSDEEESASAEEVEVLSIGLTDEEQEEEEELSPSDKYPYLRGSQRLPVPPALYPFDPIPISDFDASMLRFWLQGPRGEADTIVGKLGAFTVDGASLCRLSSSPGRDRWLNDKIVDFLAAVLNVRACDLRRLRAEPAADVLDPNLVLLPSAVESSEDSLPPFKCHTMSPRFLTKLAGERCDRYDYASVKSWTSNVFSNFWKFNDYNKSVLAGLEEDGPPSKAEEALYNNLWKSRDLVVIPSNLGSSHWALLVVQLRAQIVHVLDSMQGSQGGEFSVGELVGQQNSLLVRYAIAAARWIVDEFEAKVGSDAADFVPDSYEDWNILIHPSSQIPQQNNAVDCGMFMLSFAECIVEGRDIGSVKQKNMNYLRNRTAVNILRSVDIGNPSNAE